MIKDKEFSWIVLPMLPNFLVVFVVHMFVGTPAWEALQYAITAAVFSWVGSLVTLAWLADMYEPVSWILGIGIGVLVVGVTCFCLVSSGVAIYAKFRKP